METQKNKITLNLNGDAEVSVKGFIAPFEYSSSDFHVEWDELANLQVAEPEKKYPASVFQDFLPSESVSVGECWQVQEEGALTLLRQLSPQPQMKLHINSGNTHALWGCLRAYNNEFAEILFRIHGQFVMERGWLTPSQFAGHLVIDRLQEKVVSFKMYVPEATVLNFDIGWTQEDGNTYADMGLCPQMELSAGTQPQNAEFVASITQEEAERALALQFYKFQQINWVSLEEALKIAPVEQKPVHAISVDGPLADESC